jgi:membrane protein DedA with SNARE-associated domain
MEDASESLGAWMYGAVAALAFLETGVPVVALVVPGEATVVIGGAFAGRGTLSLALVMLLAWLCAWLGDLTNFAIGRRLGRPFLLRHGARLRVNRARLAMIERHFAAHGAATVVVGRFLAFVRTATPFCAGAGAMRVGRFALWSLLATGLWAASFTVLGYASYRSLALAGERAADLSLAAAVAVAVALAGLWIRHWWRRLDRSEARHMPN